MQEIAELLHRIQARSHELLGVPAWVGIDHEGANTILRRWHTTHFPMPMGLAATGDPDLYHEAARIQTLEARALGVGMIYGPVLDLATNPRNPETNIRPYAGDPETAARFGARYIQAAREEGIVCTTKHFPGRGRGTSNAHIELETVDTPREEYDRTDLEAFRLAVAAGTPAIMVAHTHYTAYQTERCPATLSREIVTGLLREQLGYDGLVIPDTLTMFAVSKNYPVPEAAVRALEAGIDQIFMKVASLYQPCVDAIEEAVRSGRVPEGELDGKVRRVLRAKWEANLAEPQPYEREQVEKTYGAAAHAETAREVALRSAVVTKRGERLPISLSPEQNILAVAPRSMALILANDPGNSHDHLPNALRRHHQNVTFHLVDDDPTENQCFEAEALLQNADLLVFGFTNTLHSDGLKRLYEQLANAEKYPGGKVPIVVVNAGIPWLWNELDGFDSGLQTFGYVRPLMEAAADILFGKEEAGGSFPVEVGPDYPKGYSAK
jgi:beta-N-acetylhexosaminidase